MHVALFPQCSPLHLSCVMGDNLSDYWFPQNHSRKHNSSVTNRSYVSWRSLWESGAVYKWTPEGIFQGCFFFWSVCQEVIRVTVGLQFPPPTPAAVNVYPLVPPYTWMAMNAENPRMFSSPTELELSVHIQYECSAPPPPNLAVLWLVYGLRAGHCKLWGRAAPGAACPVAGLRHAAPERDDPGQSRSHVKVGV